MSESRRDPEHLLVLLAQCHSNPFAESRGASANIDSDIEDFASHDANQFPLRLPDLIMQASQDPRVDRDWLSCTNCSQSQPSSILFY